MEVFLMIKYDNLFNYKDIYNGNDYSIRIMGLRKLTFENKSFKKNSNKLRWSRTGQ